jgi:ABC-type phosphate/phosphonate transport system permease subunit
MSAVLMRLTDFFLVLPSLVLAIALSSVLVPGIGTIILAVGLTSWPTAARLVRAQTLTVEARPYIERSRALGAGHLHVITMHVLPAVLPLVFVDAVLPRPRRPGRAAAVVGDHAARRVGEQRDPHRRVVVPAAAGYRHRRRGAGVHHVRPGVGDGAEPTAAGGLSGG